MTRYQNTQARPGFTAIEMMVVTALMLLLLTLILPSLQKAREHADALRCQARLHQLGKFMGMYTDRNNGYFPQMFYETQGGDDPRENESFILQTVGSTLAQAGLDGMPLSQFVCPSDPNPGMAALKNEDGTPAGGMPLSYSYNVGTNLWGMQYWNMMDITAYERWPVLFDGQYGPHISGPYLSPQDFANQTVVSRHPIDSAYVLYADWHVEPLLEFRYHFAPKSPTTVVIADPPVDPAPPGGEPEEPTPPAPPEDEVPEFEIEDGEIIVNEDFIASIQIIGTAISMGSSYDMPVTVRITAGGDPYQPWGNYGQAVSGAVSAGSTWEYQGEAGDAISLEARSWAKRRDYYSGNSNSHWQEYISAQSTGGPGVEILRNGSDVPDVGGFLDQTGVGEMVAGYVENDKIKLEDNQVIALFEIGSTNPSSDAFDLQDLVVVITLDPRKPEGQ